MATELDRYTYTEIMEGQNGESHYNLYSRPISKVEIIDCYHRVELREVNRLDIISLKQYGTSKLWWFIASVNNIIDPFYIPVGVTLKIPSLRMFYESEGEI